MILDSITIHSMIDYSAKRKMGEPYKHHFVGNVRFRDPKGDLAINLSPELADQIVKICAHEIIRATTHIKSEAEKI